MKTPEDFRRDDVRSIFKRRLCDDTITLRPLYIKIQEGIDYDQTLVDMSFEKAESGLVKTYNFEKQPGNGFVDSIYKTCYNVFSEEYSSIKNISLVDLIVKPIFSLSRTNVGSDAKTDVIFRIETKQHGLSEFRHRSRSIIHSSLAATLCAFQFYVNCDKTFKLLRFILDDAKERKRYDIVESCRSDMSALTRVNNYV